MSIYIIHPHFIIISETGLNEYLEREQSRILKRCPQCTLTVITFTLRSTNSIKNEHIVNKENCEYRDIDNIALKV